MNTLLKLKKINLKYQTGKDNISVLKNIDLTIKKKETVSVVGESGSGKTSLIMLIGGLERPTSGKIIFQDREITNLNEDEVSEIRKQNIGIIFQSFYLIPNYTAVENVALTLELNEFKNPEKEAKSLLDRFGLKHRFDNLPSQLSGGERNRVHLAKMLKDPGNVLLLDEPTNDLDVDTLRALEEAILDFSGCVVVISHDRWFLNKLATHILAFEGGSHVEWFEGNYQDYELDKKRRLGDEALNPKRIKYKPILR